MGSASAASESAVPPGPRLPTEPNDAVRSSAPPSTRLPALAARMLPSAASATFPVVCDVMTWPTMIEPDWSSMLMFPSVEVAFNVPRTGLDAVPLLVKLTSSGVVPPMPVAAVRVMSLPPTDPPAFSSWMLPSGALKLVSSGGVLYRAIDQKVALRAHGYLLLRSACVVAGEGDVDRPVGPNAVRVDVLLRRGRDRCCSNRSSRRTRSNPVTMLWWSWKCRR